MHSVTPRPQHRTVQRLIELGVSIVLGDTFCGAQNWRRRVDTIYRYIDGDYVRIGTVLTRTHAPTRTTDFATFAIDELFFSDGVNIDWLLERTYADLLYQA
jgi:hypothetical protein